MKNKFKVTIERWAPTALEPADRIYRIRKIRGAVGVFGAGSAELYRVGDRLTEKDIIKLFDNCDNDITVTI